MAISSVGYAGEVTEADWPVFAWNIVAGYTVAGAGDWKVTKSGDLLLSVADGVAVGAGVMDTGSGVTAPTVPTASSARWDLVALRRNWSTGETTLVRVEGSGSRAIPAGREATPGTLDDQPLALVRVESGAIQEVVDLRVWSFDGGVVASDPLVLGYVNRIGAEVRIGDTVYQRIINSIGVEEWATTNVALSGPVTPTIGTGWSQTSGYPVTVRGVGSETVLEGAITSGSTSSFANMLTIPVGFRPATRALLPALVASNGTVYTLNVYPDGTVLVPENYRTGGIGGAGTTFSVSARWRRT